MKDSKCFIRKTLDNNIDTNPKKSLFSGAVASLSFFIHRYYPIRGFIDTVPLLSLSLRLLMRRALVPFQRFSFLHRMNEGREREPKTMI